jgi:hypothetical protein
VPIYLYSQLEKFVNIYKIDQTLQFICPIAIDLAYDTIAQVRIAAQKCVRKGDTMF